MTPHQPTADLRFEFALHAQGYRQIAGLDEVGRGAWAGPVVAGAVILPLDRFDLAATLREVHDSKQLSPRRRKEILPIILQTATGVGIGHATNQEIDAVGIVPATRLAMQRALSHLPEPPDALLTDAICLPDLILPCESLIRGDQRSLSIAAASIVAKVARDQAMADLDDRFPPYGFMEHKGYGTALHRRALAHFGPSPVHRLTFAPVQAAAADHDTSPDQDRAP